MNRTRFLLSTVFAYICKGMRAYRLLLLLSDECDVLEWEERNWKQLDMYLDLAILDSLHQTIARKRTQIIDDRHLSFMKITTMVKIINKIDNLYNHIR